LSNKTAYSFLYFYKEFLKLIIADEKRYERNIYLYKMEQVANDLLTLVFCVI